MNLRILTFVLAIVVECFSSVATARTWTDRSGRQIEAEFVSADGNNVTVRRSNDQKLFLIPLSRLSDTDQLFVKSQVDSIASRSAAKSESAVPKWRVQEFTVVTPVMTGGVVVTGACVAEIKVELAQTFEQMDSLTDKDWETRASDSEADIEDLHVLFFSKPKENVAKLVIFWAGESSLASIIEFRLKGENAWVKLEKTKSATGENKEAPKLANATDMRFMLKKVATGDGQFFAIPDSPIAGSAGLKTTLTVTRSRKEIKFAGLVFADSCKLEIHTDGTLLVDREGIVVRDNAAKQWKSAKVTLDGTSRIVFLPNH